MKKILLVSLLSMICFTGFTQELLNVNSIIDAGVALHDKGNYRAAISKYDEALKYEKDNVTALAEKAYSLLSLKEYQSSIKTCKRAIKTHPQSKSLKFVYTTYANALDGYKKPKEAIKIYDEGIELFPNYYHLYYNKGITLSGLKKYDEALLCFEKSAKLNPKHASSHNGIARVLVMKKQNIPSLLAFCRFAIIEPQGGRAKANLPFIKKIMSANVEKTGENSVTINIDPNMLSDSEKENLENDFSTTDLILSMLAALDYDDKNKGKTERELFVEKFETVCSSLEEVRKDNYGFYWEYYVPYFIELKEKKFLKTFSYLVYATSDEESIQDWLGSNKNKIEDFYKWSSNYKWK